MDMNEIISALLEQGGWGLLIVLAFIIVLNVINNPAIISEAVKLIDRFAKSKSPIECGNFKIFKLTRTYPQKWISALKIVTTIANIILLGSLGFLVYFILVSPLPQEISIKYQLLLAILFLLPVLSLIDMYAPIRSSMTLELDGTLETLSRFCLKKLFDMGALIDKLDFNAEAREIEARLHGNKIAIKIKKQQTSHNEFTLSSEARFFSNSPGYRRKINDIVHSLCYPEEE